jgi:hypothetical protein
MLIDGKDQPETGADCPLWCVLDAILKMLDDSIYKFLRKRQQQGI